MKNELTKKGQFIKLDFTAKIKLNDEVFDTSREEDAKKANLPQGNVKPVVLCIGESMVLKGLDKALEGKELGKEYSVDIPSKEAFGLRDPKLVKIIPINIFKSKGIMPYPGLILNMDNMIARISAVSGGRVITDFNNSLAGKDVIYNFKIQEVIVDKREKLKCLVAYFFKEDPEKAIKSIENGKAVIETKIKWPQKFLGEILEKVNKLTSLKIEVKSV